MPCAKPHSAAVDSAVCDGCSGWVTRRDLPLRVFQTDRNAGQHWEVVGVGDVVFVVGDHRALSA